jgi:antiviral defense system Shedu protein SduA
MAHDNWRDAIADIDIITGAVTSRQKALAAIADIELPEDLPQLIAQVRLQAALADDLGFPYSASKGAECSEFQRKLIENLKGDSDIDVNALNAGEASAWIAYFYLKARRRALEILQLEAGDVVEILGSHGQFEQVSSIGNNGRIHFKGGAGAGAWPDKVSLRCKKLDQSAAAQEMTQKALNQATLRARVGEWTEDKHRNLDEFEINSPLASEDIELLYDVIEGADDEKPIQQFIESHPQILGALLGGDPRFCVPRPQLGGKYVPDFLVGDVDSLGIRWVLVELETPKSTVTLKGSNELEQHARKGMSQISEWREWLQNNLDMARRGRRHDGLGLIDIRPQSDGLVLVGRRSLLLDNTHMVRNRFREENRIRIHTYDWLIEQLNGILSFVGPPRTSPYVIRP